MGAVALVNPFVKKVIEHFTARSTNYTYLILIGFLLAGLWPFNFVTPNRALIEKEGGLVLERHGTVYVAAHVEKLHGIEQFTIFLDLVTASDGLSAFEKIVSLADSQRDMNFIVGQWKDGVVLHIPDHARQKEIHFGKSGVFKEGVRTRLTLAYDGMNLSLHQDGRPVKVRRTGPLSFSGWSWDYPLVIGTEATGRSQWRGTIYEIAVWDRAMATGEVQGLRGHKQTADGRQQTGRSKKGLHNAGDSNDRENRSGPLVHYVFKPEFTYSTEYRGMKALGVRDLGGGPSADLVIPEQFIPARRAFLAWESDWTDKAQNWQDVFVNIVGFVPMGFLSFLFFKSRNAERCELALMKRILSRCHSSMLLNFALAVTAGFVLSFFIEYLQAYLPSRDSSLRDLIMNTVGTSLGWVGCWALFVRLYSGEPGAAESSCKS